MKNNRFCAGLLFVSLLFGTGLADDVKRNVGSDGVPVISIRGEKPKADTVDVPVVATKRKEFKVYDLGNSAPPATETTKVVVLSSPPPIAPAANYGYGYGWGFPGAFGPGFNNGYYNGGFVNAGFNNGFYNGGFVNAGLRTGGFYQNYTNPPVNYQNPPVNYRPLPVNRGFRPAFCR